MEKRRLYVDLYRRAVKKGHPMGEDLSVWPSYALASGGLTTTVFYAPGSQDFEIALSESTLDHLRFLDSVL